MYAKIFRSMYDGTLRGKAHELLVFTNMLVSCDRDGCVDKHPRAIADEVGLTIEQVRAAIETLEAPDPESRTPDSEGRRLVRLDGHRAWGWKIVNYVKYRDIKNAEDRIIQNREAQARWRSRQSSPRNAASARVSTPNHESAASAHADADADADAEVEADAEASKNAARSSAPTSAVRSRSRKQTDTICWNPIGGWEGIAPSDRNAWAIAYPACDINRQLAAMDQWLRANPAKARKRRWRAFATNWLSRSQDKGGDVTSNHVNGFHDFKQQSDDARKAKLDAQIARVLAKMPD